MRSPDRDGGVLEELVGRGSCVFLRGEKAKEERGNVKQRRSGDCRRGVFNIGQGSEGKELK